MHISTSVLFFQFPSVSSVAYTKAQMLAIHTLVFALGAFLSLPQTTLGGPVQCQNLVLSADAEQNKKTVKQLFTDSYAVYK